MKLLSILGIAVFGTLLAVVILFIVKSADSKQGQALGLVNQQLADCSRKPNCVNSEAGTTDAKRVEPLAIAEGHAQQEWQRLQALIEQSGGVLQRVEEGYLAAIFTSSLFGFVDDFEARLDVKNGVIHLRSASRVGTSDFGVNRTRVEQLRLLYNNADPRD